MNTCQLSYWIEWDVLSLIFLTLFVNKVSWFLSCLFLSFSRIRNRNSGEISISWLGKNIIIMIAFHVFFSVWVINYLAAIFGCFVIGLSSGGGKSCLHVWAWGRRRRGDPWLQTLVLHIQAFTETFRLHKWRVNQKYCCKPTKSKHIKKAVQDCLWVK